ncbi:ATP-dependent helicase HrpB [Paenibacillus sp. 1011MAR3C5]|uniref:ATP-dependent helicase HrpB n=1 Tax=Paenibacillus sp. 1011MAR3C5 TaxID=1675787 RepID=UPI000E6C6B0A|nr:ATP-dependent helicase HrpB [Paenibacillus sp. 1011MAR3C5]RJE86872.1 ATP-dependent helicase HrpB [Paenibacillus sp. 1011MAR3C5]
MTRLPIDEVLPELLLALQSGNGAVLVAEPGAGKTTRVPLALLEQPWLGGKKIVMLEPRRLSARSAAQYMARMLGEKVGETVGYRVRLDSKVGPRTLIEVVTEGVLTRMLQEDPSLDDVGAVLFDEFHERHLHGDLGLALCLEAQSLLREELRLLVMSATLEAEPVADLLGGAAVIRSKGRSYPVTTHYAPARSTAPLEQAVGQAIFQVMREADGDVLVFLPGAAEIRRTASWLRGQGLPAGVRLAELHGSLTLDEQASAIAPCAPNERKIVLSTSVAESSLTVEGVKIVVDSGLSRVPRFSPRTGLSRLETVPVSRDSADQRRGRAGRVAPGYCYRMWTEQEHHHLPLHTRPEMLDADLSALALELAVWGTPDPAELQWLTPPPQAAYDGAVALLQSLNAMDEHGKPTPSGQRIAKLGMHPRLGAMLLAAEEQPAALERACELAALLSERDLLGSERNVDIALRVDALRKAGGKEPAAHRIKSQAQQWKRRMDERRADEAATNLPHNQSKTWAEGSLLASAYPDRIAQRRPDGRYVMANGRGAVLPELQPLSRSPYLVVCELDDAGSEGRIRLAAGISLPEIEASLPAHLTLEEAVEWDAGTQSVRARRRMKLGAIVLSEVPLEGPDPEAVADTLLRGIRLKGISALPMSKNAASLLGRMRLMSLSGDPQWPDVSDEALLDTMELWLKPHIYGMKSLSDLGKLPMAQLVGDRMTWKQTRELDEQVPTHITVPSGSRIPIDYSNPGSPVLAVRLQELFGWRETPRLVNGRLPLTLHLLSPSQRPVQVTKDLASFWELAYFEVKKDLKGRYPKHYWPDDPYEAVATNRAKPRAPQS